MSSRPSNAVLFLLVVAIVIVGVTNGIIIMHGQRNERAKIGSAIYELPQNLDEEERQSQNRMPSQDMDDKTNAKILTEDIR